MSKFFEATKQMERTQIAARSPLHQVIPDTAPYFPAAMPAPPPPAAASDPAVSAFRTVSVHTCEPVLSLALGSTHAQAMERYRLVRTKIVQHPRKPRVLCVSSASPGDGKTLSALNTATSLALKNDTTVLLVDADLRRPQLAQILGIAPVPGLAEVLAGTCSVEDAIVRIAEVPRLCFLPAGRNPQNPTELLDSTSLRGFIEWVHKTFTFGIVDSPPVGILADYDLIQSVCDGVLLIVRPGHTKRVLLQKTLDQMPSERFLGVLINATDDWFLWRTHDSSYYYDYHSTCQTHE